MSMQRFQCHLTARQRQLAQEAARIEDCNLSEFVRRAIVREAQRLKQQRQEQRRRGFTHRSSSTR